MIELYNQGVTLREIGQELGFSRTSVSNYIRALTEDGYEIIPRQQAVNQSDFMNDKRKVMKLIKLYTEDFTYREIEHAMNITTPTIMKYIRILREQGVELKVRGMGRRSDTKGKRMRISISAEGSASSKQDTGSNQRLQEIMQKQKRS